MSHTLIHIRTILLCHIALLLTLLLTGCQDEDFGYTKEEIFESVYKRNFVKAFGEIDPNETWDLSSFAAGGKRKRGITRSVVNGITLDDEGYYRVQPTTLNYIISNIGSVSASDFILRYNYESFTFIPIYLDQSLSKWTFNIRLFQKTTNKVKDGVYKCNNVDQNPAIWDRSNSNVQIASACSKCGGLGYIPATCDNCHGAGTVQTEITCPQCLGSPNSTCTTCSNSIIKWFFNFFRITCPTCGGDGIITCNNCNGNKLYESEDCPKCSGSGTYGTVSCSQCGGVAGTLNWNNETDGTKNALATRSKTIELSSINGGTSGDIMYPYCLYNNTYISSIDSKFKYFQIPRPENISDCDVYALACDVDNDNDFMDIVFLVVGHTAVPKAFSSTTSYTSINKRYLIEDLCSNSDFDFNDIVVDFNQMKSFTISKIKNKTGNYEANIIYSQSATLKHICGTRPFQVTIGNYTFKKVTDPTSQSQIKTDLGLDCQVTKPSEGDGFDISYTVDVTGWDNNNISVKVWKEDESAYEGGQIVPTATFPEPGTVPFIIATDQTKDWVKTDMERIDLTKYY